MVQPLWNTIWQFLKNLNIELPYDPAILPLGIYPKELKAGIQTDIFTSILIAALSTIAKRWKQPKCSLIDEGTNKMLYICAVEYYSAFKKGSSDTHHNMNEP